MTSKSKKKKATPPLRVRGGASFACPECDNPTRVKRTRRDAEVIKRDRLCEQCGWRSETWERIAA